MLAARDGDERAFDLLVRRHAPRMRAVARRVLGNEADADEAAQEVFWRAWRAASRWQPGNAQVGTWLYRITVNVCLDRHRRRKRRAESLDHEAATATADASPGAEQRLIARQTLRHVLAAIAKLTAEQRTALVLSVQQGLPNSEIAAAMTISEGAVEQLLVRARRALRQVRGSVS